MRQVNLKPFVILALNLDSPKAEEALLKSRGYQFKPLIGNYQGVSEASYLITFNNKAELQSLFELACEFKQESILVADNERHCTLVYTNNEHQTMPLGYLKPITQLDALKSESFTYDVSTNTYYKAI